MKKVLKQTTILLMVMVMQLTAVTASANGISVSGWISAGEQTWPGSLTAGLTDGKSFVGDLYDIFPRNVNVYYSDTQGMCIGDAETGTWKRIMLNHVPLTASGIGDLTVGEYSLREMPQLWQEDQTTLLSMLQNAAMTWSNKPSVTRFREKMISFLQNGSL